ncbi:MAG: cytochrome c oxidase subunit 2, partial [Bacteroidota bacterium]|nr:cytochrome c oxidase subunit 2 [Bacteroidota bacterium]
MHILNSLEDCLFFVAHCDAPEAWQLGIQDPATPVMEGMLFFHNYLLFFLIVIGVFVFWLLTYVIINFNEHTNPIAQKFTHSSALEIVWTILPAVVLLLIAVPSFALLYSLDELIDPAVTLKVIGHQWYWSYEYADFYDESIKVGVINFDSYMVPTDDLVMGSFRLLEVDNRVVLPINTHIRILVTAADVLHSWAVPSFGIKLDGCPGRLSQTSLFIKRVGVYYGQCSEICGVNHGFMPIVVRGVSLDQYTNWIAIQIMELFGDQMRKNISSPEDVFNFSGLLRQSIQE